MDLAERHNGVWGGCWCTWFHPACAERGKGAEGNRALKEQWVREGLAEGLALVDRLQRSDTPHPMRHRNGEGVEERLGQCPLYDPELDLAVETPDGQVAGYSLFWYDPVTKVGLVEPVRVEEEYQRRGLARAMLTAGIDRLAMKGAQRVKIGFGTEAAADLYQDIGFQPTSTDTCYEGRTEHLTRASSG